MDSKDQIVKSLQKASGQTEIKLDIPENKDFGDYSTNIALTYKGEILKGKVSHSPRQFAEEIVKKLEADKELSKAVDKIQIAGPGFINFFLKKEVLTDLLLYITSHKDTYGYSSVLNNNRIAVEYTDPNPFKEFHIGHLYSNLIGESISKILEANGAKVWRGDFYGDVGLHVAKSVWGIMQKMESDKVTLEDLAKLSIKERQKFMGEGYANGSNKYEEDETIKEQIKDINYMVYVASQEVLEKEKAWKPLINYRKYIEGNMELYEKVKPIYQKGLRWSLDYFETYYERLGTKFDGYYPESWVGEYGVKIVEKGLKKGVLEKSDGAIVFKGEKYGLHTRVFLNKFGLPTYEAKDLGLAKAKYEDFKYDKSINIFGKEIDDYYYVVKKAMQLIEPELGNKAGHIAHGMVNLPEGKMSSRKGNIITVEWLLNEAKDRCLKLIDNPKLSRNEKLKVAEMVGQAAIKYALLKSNIGNNVTFDFNQSISFDGNSGPYLQYTFARCQSILAKSNRNGTSVSKDEVFQGYEPNPEEEILLRTFIHFPEVVAEAAEKYAPNLICSYLYDLAQKYNAFYNAHRIVGSENEAFRLALTEATGIVLKNGLKLLGIDAPKRM